MRFGVQGWKMGNANSNSYGTCGIYGRLPQPTARQVGWPTAPAWRDFKGRLWKRFNTHEPKTLQHPSNFCYLVRQLPTLNLKSYLES